MCDVTDKKYVIIIMFVSKDIKKNYKVFFSVFVVSKNEGADSKYTTI